MIRLAMCASLALACATESWATDAVFQAADPPTPSTGSVSVSIEAQSTSVLGEKVKFRLEEKGDPVKSRIWSVYPTGVQGFDTYESGTKADFANPIPGPYVFIVSVATEGGLVAHDVHTLEIGGPAFQAIQQAAQQPQQPAAPAPAISKSMAPPAQSLPQAVPKASTLPAKIKTLTLAANSKMPENVATSQSEQIASVLIQTAGALDTGLMNGENFWGQARSLAMMVPGMSKEWNPWFDAIGQELEQATPAINQQPNANAVKANILRNVARILRGS